MRKIYLILITTILIISCDNNNKTEISSMPGVYRIPLSEIPDAVGEAQNYGIPAIALFPHTEASKKNANGSEALNKNNLVCKALRLIKKIIRI